MTRITQAIIDANDGQRRCQLFVNILALQMSFCYYSFYTNGLSSSITPTPVLL
jgi:hypothetical protein